MRARRSKREHFGKGMVFMKKLSLITGALGHLGNTVAGMLARRGELVRGLDAMVVHPSGLIGPGVYGRGHLTQLVMDFLDGRLTAGVAGGYDFADVRDVAEGILEAAQKGRCGQCYILSGSYHSIPDLLERLHKISGRRRVKTVLPLWFARLTAPLEERYYKLLRQKPLYTKYSLYTLTSNANFSCEKAKRELGYAPRNFDETLKDTVAWLRETHKLKN